MLLFRSFKPLSLPVRRIWSHIPWRNKLRHSPETRDKVNNHNEHTEDRSSKELLNQRSTPFSLIGMNVG